MKTKGAYLLDVYENVSKSCSILKCGEGVELIKFLGGEPPNFELF